LVRQDFSTNFDGRWWVCSELKFLNFWEKHALKVLVEQHFDRYVHDRHLVWQFGISDLFDLLNFMNKLLVIQTEFLLVVQLLELAHF
jgi:hypothetical protein